MTDRGRGRGRGRNRGADRGCRPGWCPPPGPAVFIEIASPDRFSGVRRPVYGTQGVPIDIIVNCFRANVPTSWIHHYDIEILPADKPLPPRVTVAIIRRMQDQNPTIFIKRGSYDGRKTLYSPIEYPLGGREQFHVNVPDRPRSWVVRIKFVAKINLDSAVRYIEGNGNDNLTRLNARNVAIRMQPTHRMIPFNSRSSFTRDQARDIGHGRESWRCFFQPVRPVIGKMVINVDISSAAVYQSGPSVKLHLEYLGASPEVALARFLSANNLDARTRRDLAKFLRNLNVIPPDKADAKPKSIKNVSEEEANNVLLEANDTTTFVVVNNVSEEEANNELFEANDTTISVAGDSIWKPFLLGEILARFLPTEWRARFLRPTRQSTSLTAL